MYKRNKTGDHNAGGVDEAQLLAYIDGSLPPEEQHRLEELLERDPFLNDAVEGLAAVKDKEQLKAIAAQINAQLSRQIRNRRQQRRNRPKLTDHWGWVFVLVLLLLILVSWLVMKTMLK